MECYDCALAGEHRTTVGICRSCGAASCAHHLHATDRTLRRPANPGVVERTNPARRLLCDRCHRAEHS